MPPSPRKTILPHLRVARMAVARAASLRRTIHGALHAEAAGQLPHLGHIVRARREHRVAEAEVERDLHALRNHIDADDLVGAEFAAERAGGQAHRAQAGDEHGVIAVDADLFQAFVDGAESARHLRAIGVGKLRRADAIRSFSSAIMYSAMPPSRCQP